MKKAIVAVFAAASTTVASAQVTVYGIIDQAVRVTDGETSQVSGSYNTSRLGVKGTEDLEHAIKECMKLDRSTVETHGKQWNWHRSWVQFKENLIKVY